MKGLGQGGDQEPDGHSDRAPEFLCGDKEMELTERAAMLLALRKLCSILFFNVLFLTLLAQNLWECYYIQPGRTIGYQSSSNSPAIPALRPGMQLSQIRSFVRTPKGN